MFASPLYAQLFDGWPSGKDSLYVVQVERRKWRTEQKEWLEEQLPTATGRYGPLRPCSLTSFVLILWFVYTYTSCQCAAYVLPGHVKLLSRSPDEAAAAAAAEVTYMRIACKTCIVCNTIKKHVAESREAHCYASAICAICVRNQAKHRAHCSMYTVTQ